MIFTDWPIPYLKPSVNITLWTKTFIMNFSRQVSVPLGQPKLQNIHNLNEKKKI